MTEYDVRLAKEQKSGFRTAFLINASFLFYLGLMLYYVVTLVQETEVLEFNWVTGIGVLSIIVSYIWTLNRASTGRMIVERTNKVLKAHIESHGVSSRPWLTGTLSGWVTMLILILTIWVGMNLTEMSAYKLFSSEGMNGAKRIFMALVTPNFAIIGMVIAAMIETIFIALMATLIAIPISFFR